MTSLRYVLLELNLVIVVFFAFFNTFFVHFRGAYKIDRFWRQREIISKIRQVSELISVSSLREKPEFREFSEKLKNMKKPPYLIFFDSGNLEIFLNHICNLQLISNAVDRLVGISFDRKAMEILNQKYPKIPTMLVEIDIFQKSLPSSLKNRDYILKSLILLIRTRICVILAEKSINFWVMQQDSLWLESFEAMDLEERFSHKFLIFDVIGNDQSPIYRRMDGWICGSTFFVRGNPTTAQFFRQVDDFTLSHQSPDSAIMTYLCGHRGYKCQRLPRWVASCSNYFTSNRTETPVILQVDTAQPGKSKMQMFKDANFIFRMENGTCNTETMKNIRQSVKAALPERKNKARRENREGIFRKFRFFLKKFFNVDPYNNKSYLSVYYGLI